MTRHLCGEPALGRQLVFLTLLHTTLPLPHPCPASCTPDQVYLWLDIFAVNQHPGDSQRNDLERLKEVVADAQQTLMVLDGQGMVLTRIWWVWQWRVDIVWGSASTGCGEAGWSRPGTDVVGLSRGKRILKACSSC